jgi:hypothetical protein
MKRTLWFLLYLPLLTFAQREERIVSYDIRAALNERTGSMAGTISVMLERSAHRSDPLSFLVPKSWEIAGLRDRENDAVDFERSAAERPAQAVIVIEETNDADTLLLQIDFTARFDSSRYAEMFITAGELLLPCSDSLFWLPTFNARTAERVSLNITADPAMSLFCPTPLDTLLSEGRIHWSLTTSQNPTLASVFTLAGIVRAVHATAYNSDSSQTVTFTVPPSSFDKRYAVAAAQQLNDAIRFFSALTGKRTVPHLQYVIAGGATFTPEIVETPSLIIHRSSPAYMQFDSSALTRSAYNHWLMETARRFCPATTDSTAFFDDGLAAYLAQRYLSVHFPELQQQERLTTIANTLTFFPQAPTIAGHRSAAETDELVSYRGRYILMMLEYLLGTPSFDSVLARMTLRFAAEPASIAAFQQLCEEEYGTPLTWFFDQWFRRATAPEFVLQWSHAKTPRGMSVVTVTVEQRGALFTMPVPLMFTFGNRNVVKRVMIEQGKQDFTFVFPSPPASVELDPQYAVLRWLLEIRISAHARTSLQHLSIGKDIANAEREAQYTLQLDPNNSTGSAPLIYFVLGNSAAARNEREKGKEYFQKAISAGASPEMERYKLLSLVQYASLLQMEGKNEEANGLYRRVITEGMADPLLYERAIIKAELRLHGAAGSGNDAWFEVQ